MRIGAISFEGLRDAVGCVLLAAAGIGLAIAAPQVLRLVDRGFALKCRDDPTAAARQVGIFRMLGVLLVSMGVSLLALKFFGAEY